MPHNLLVVDDDVELLKVLKTYWGDTLGYAVTAVTSGQEGLEAAMRENFDLAIPDVRVEGMLGTETYTRLKKIQPGIKAIFFTADHEFERTMDFLKFSLPAERVLTKPLEDMAELTRLIIGILGPPAP